MNIPNTIQKYITADMIENTIGMSSSKILVSDTYIIKIEEYHNESKREFEVLKWAQNKLPVPTILEYTVENDISYIVMSKLEGEMAIAEDLLRTPKKLIELLAEAIKRLWTIDIDLCPITNSLDNKLKEANQRILNNQIVIDEIDFNYLATKGIHNISELYDWLVINRIEEDRVFTHGDFCLPNVFFKDNTISGYIDLGRAGIADRYQDIALCTRSLSYNLNIAFDDPYITYFHKCLGLEINWEKINYYILLDELF